MEESTKLRSVTKGKEKRQIYNQNENQQKRNIKHQTILRSDLSQLVPPQAHCSSSPVKKYLNEANKIIKIGIEKEFALQEKDNILQNMNDTIDNLRKNIIHLQMEYEKLDQNYQKEISCRSEIIKRMDATRSIVDSAVHYSNKLSVSVKKLEDDKLKIAEFYELICQSQKEVEKKHSDLEKLIEEKDIFLKTKIVDIKKAQEEFQLKGAEKISQLSAKLSTVTDKLNVASKENEKYQLQIKELQETLNNLETSSLEQKKLNHSLKENIGLYETLLKNWKSQKCKYYKLWKNERKKTNVFKCNSKKFKKISLKNEDLYKKTLLKVKALEVDKEELKTKFSKQQDAITVNQASLEFQNEELKKKIILKEQEADLLKAAKKNLEDQFIILRKNEEDNKIITEKLENNFDEVIEENKQIKEKLKKLNEENHSKTKIVSELEAKLKSHDSGCQSEIILFKKESEKFKEMVKILEEKLSNSERRASTERAQKNKIITDLSEKLDGSLTSTGKKIDEFEVELKLKINQINELCKEIKQKDRLIDELKDELSKITFENSKNLEKLKNEFLSEKSKCDSLNASLDGLRENHKILKNDNEKTKNQVLELEEKLDEEISSNKVLKAEKENLEKTVKELQKEIDQEKRAGEALKQKNKKLEIEVKKLQEGMKENSSLKSTIADLKNLLEETNAKIEAYKIVVKKLESEKLETNSQNEELSKLKSEVSRLESLVKKNEIKVLETPQKNVKDRADKNNLENIKRKTGEKTLGFVSQSDNAKENEPLVTEVISLSQNSPVSVQQNKKFLSTPRKIFTSTPQRSFRTLTPIRKKRDPYEFDSDSSVERFDPEQVLKVFNNRAKKEPNKKSKSNK